MPNENGTGLASRESIISSHDRTTREIEIPRWGRLRIRELDGSQLIGLGKMVEDGEPNIRIAAAWVAQGVVDHDGKRLFSDQDVDALLSKNHQHITSVFEAIQAISSETEEAIAKALGEWKGTPSTSSSTHGDSR